MSAKTSTFARRRHGFQSSESVALGWSVLERKRHTDVVSPTGSTDDSRRCPLSPVAKRKHHDDDARSRDRERIQSPGRWREFTAEGGTWKQSCDGRTCGQGWERWESSSFATTASMD